MMEVSSFANASLASLLDDCSQCCRGGSGVDIAAARGGNRDGRLWSPLPRKARIHKVAAKRCSGRSVDKDVDEAVDFLQELCSSKSVLNARHHEIADVANSVSLQWKGYSSAKETRKISKFRCEWMEDLSNNIIQIDSEQLKGTFLHKCNSIQTQNEDDFLVQCISQGYVNKPCLGLKYSSSANRVGFEMEASENNRPVKRIPSKSEKMRWHLFMGTALAANTVALAIVKLQFMFKDRRVGDSSNIGMGDGGGIGSSGGWGQGGGGMEESGPNKGLVRSSISDSDEHDGEEVSATTCCEEVKGMRDSISGKMPTLASLSSATSSYRLNSDLAAGGERSADSMPDRTVGQTGRGAYEQLLRLANEVPQKNISNSQTGEHRDEYNQEEFGDNSTSKSSNSKYLLEGIVKWFEGEAPVHLTRIGIRPRSQSTSPSTHGAPSIEKGTNAQLTPSSSGAAASEMQQIRESDAKRSICDDLSSPLPKQFDAKHQSANSFKPDEKLESKPRNAQLDSKVFPTNRGRMERRTEASVHAGNANSQKGSSPSDQMMQKEAVLGRITGLLHSTMAKRTDGHEDSSRNTQETDDQDQKNLVSESVSQVLQQLLERSGDEGLARKYEIGALKRLQREIFTDLLKIRERLDKLEHHLGLRQIKSLGDPVVMARTRFKAAVHAGAAFVLLNDVNHQHSRSALDQAGMQTGLDVSFTFETPFRDNKDILILECGTGRNNDSSEDMHLGGLLHITKVAYAAQVSDELTISVIPLGAEAKDVSEMVNSLQDEALTRFASRGPPLVDRFKGSAIGVTFRNTDALLSIAQCLSGWGTNPSRFSSFDGEPLCSSTLATCIYQPSDRMIFSFSAVNNFYPTPPLPSSTRLHWSEMGPLTLSASCSHPFTSSAGTSLRVSNDSADSQGNTFRRLWNSDSFESILPESKSTSVQAFSVAGEVDIGGNINVGGWVQVDRGNLFQESTREPQWALTLSKSIGSKVQWGLCFGTFKTYFWQTAKGVDGNYLDPGGDTVEECAPQRQFEAFVNLNCGKGCSLQPGIIYAMNKHSQTPALILRAHWTL